MRRQSIPVLLVLTLFLCAFLLIFSTDFNEVSQNGEISKEEIKSPYPNDLWYQIRSYPDGFNQSLFLEKMNEINFDSKDNLQSRDADLTLSWIEEGPGNIGGRFNVLCKSDSNNDLIYAGAANGGVFKTSDGGQNWFPVFDDLAYLAVGCIAIDPANNNTVYVGTGDKNFGGGSKIGNGIYKSTDGGTNWSTIGLEQTGIITELVLHPTSSDTMYAATLGNPYEKTVERGVYKTTDGGLNWTNVLFLSDSSGVMDLVMDPSDPEVLYASGFNRINLPFNSVVKGPESDVYKTTDGGATWTHLTNGLPNTEESRVGLSISQSDPDVLYAIYVAGADQHILDVYKTTDGGLNWGALNVTSNGLDTNVHGGFGWYFGEVYVNPYDDDHIVVTGVEMFHSVDGGSTWSQNVPDWFTYEVHADKHDVLFLGPDSYIIATDGGLYKTIDHGQNWDDIENIAVSQFYHVAVDPNSSGVYGGGTQDNGTISGNELMFNFWDRLYGGDGFRLFYSELEPGAMYVETQRGNIVYVDPFFNTMNVSPDLTNDRTNWDTPYFVNEDDEELYVGTSKISMMEVPPYGVHQAISGDLTKVGLGTAIGAERSHTITEVEQSAQDSDKIMVGTSDGLVWLGERSGTWNFTNITASNLPDRYVTGIRSSPDLTSSDFYVCYSGYTLNDNSPYLYKTSDFGQTWEDISGDLPDAGINDICIVPNQGGNYIFAALDGGVYFTENGGVNWGYVGVDMPTVTARELKIDFNNEKLICGTYSRSMYSYDISWIDNLTNSVSDVSENDSEAFKIYPNPASDFVSFVAPFTGTIKIYNLEGKVVIDKVVNKGISTIIDVSNLPKGTYIVKTGNKALKLAVQ